MCKISDEIREEGRQEGELEKSKEMAKILYLEGDSLEKIARVTCVDVNQVKEWIS